MGRERLRWSVHWRKRRGLHWRGTLNDLVVPGMMHLYGVVGEGGGPVTEVRRRQLVVHPLNFLLVVINYLSAH